MTDGWKQGGRPRRAGTARTVAAVALALLATGAPVPGAAQRDFSDVEVTTRDLGSGLAMLQGAGGNVGVSTGPDGAFLIDDQFAPLTERIRTAVAKLSPEPIRFVLNTHWHGDHTGGNENLGRAGALILAHERVRTRMSSEQFMAALDRRVPPSPVAALPVITFDEGLTLHLNGETIEAIHVPPAHTDGDTLVHFREPDVLHTGDVFSNGMYPFFDASSGGGIDGMIEAQARALALAGPETKIIPGHGPLATRADLQASHDMLVTIRDRVRKEIGRGRDLEGVLESRPTRDFDEAFGGGFLRPEQFVRLVHASLTAADR